MNELLQVPPESGDRKWKAVFTIIENQGQPGRPAARDRKYWLRIGIAFVNRDGSMNVRLDAIPTNGMLHIRDQPPADEMRARRGDETAVYAQKGVA